MVKIYITACAVCAFGLMPLSAQEPTPPTTETEVQTETPPIDPAEITPPDLTPPAGLEAPLTEEQPAPIEPPGQTGVDGTAEPGATVLGETTPTATRSVNDFQGDDLGTALRLLARQAKIDVVVSDAVVGTVTMRLENRTPMEAIKIIATAKNLIVDEIDGVYYIKTPAEKAKEPTVSGHYTFSYARAQDIVPLLADQLQAKGSVQMDQRTNTVFYREAVSNLENIQLFLETVDKPTRQVMIEARLVEVNANPKQSYGINWAGVVGSSGAPQTIRYGGSDPAEAPSYQIIDGVVVETPGKPAQGVFDSATGLLQGRDFFRNGEFGPEFFDQLGGQFAILSMPQLSMTLRLLNEDSDAEFLANPRVVTADNQKATIKITRNQPVPQLNFNEQTATAVFGGFEDKEFGNTLIVTPSINKDDFVTLNVQPEISNKVGDATFVFAGATVASPVIDKRSLESKVLIKSGDTLAIGGLLQDETTKGRVKVPVLGDMPILGYLFQERLNARSKRNLLVFVTPTIIKDGYGTGLEDQVSGVTHSGEEYADPNGWRNNAKGGLRLIPTSNRQNAADYPKPGVPKPPEKKVNYKVSAPAR